jgi:diaminopimelate epimerase
VSLPFVKMAGCGNDFVMVAAADLPRGVPLEQLGRALCSQGTGIGADGFVVIDPAAAAGMDFGVTIINRSGLPAEMCGNAARCIARLASERGIAGPRHVFRTPAGDVAAVVGADRVTIRLPDPSPLELDQSVTIGSMTYLLDVIDVGVPHAVLWWEDIDGAPVETLGRSLRHHAAFPQGANINFVCPRGPRLRIRTFERGVEAETLACGTGAIACAISRACRGLAVPPVEVVTTHGGILVAGFDLAETQARAVTLSGPTTRVFEGTISDEWLAAACGRFAGRFGAP